jgi:hypothetical protein
MCRCPIRYLRKASDFLDRLRPGIRLSHCLDDRFGVVDGQTNCREMQLIGFRT